MPFKGTQQKIGESGCHPARRQPPSSGSSRSFTVAEREAPAEPRGAS
jgi:hypothetical protein